MNRHTNRILASTMFVALLATAACDAANTRPGGSNTGPTPTPDSPFTNENYAAALRSASVKLRGKLPDPADTQAVLADGEVAYNAIIDEYLDPGSNADLIPQVRGFYRSMFLMGQTIGGVNYDLPANLATYLFVNDGSVKDLVTAQYCVDNNLNVMDQATAAVECEGAPEGERAGIISTRAFLKKFGQPDTVNMRRVSVVHQMFACGIYPDTQDSIALPRTNAPPATWPMNENDTPDDTTDDFADPSLGAVSDDPADPPRLSKKYQSKLKGASGAECVQCHGLLNQRRAVFTFYDPEGIYDPERSIANYTGPDDPNDKTVESPEVNGQQDYCGVLGDTDNADTDNDPNTPSDVDDDIDPNGSDCANNGQGTGLYFGRTITTLKDLGDAIADTSLTGGRFYSCMTNRHYNFALGKSQGEISGQAAGGSGPTGMDPTILSKYKTVYESSGWSTRDLLVAIFKGPEFIAANQ